MPPEGRNGGGVVQTTGRAVRVLIGQDVLRRAVFDIQPSARQLTIRNRLPSDDKGWHRVRLTRGPNSRFCFPVDLGSDRELAFLDLGSSNPLMMSADFARRQRLLEGRRTSTAATWTVSGIAISVTSSLAQLKIGNFALSNVPVESFVEWSAPAVPVTVGLPVLARFRMMLDLAGSELWLRAEEEDLARPFTRDRTGLGVAYEGDHLRVVHVAAESPASKTGWRVGEVIVRIDGHPVSGDYVASGLCRWRYGPEHSTVELELRPHDKRSITLVNYY